MTHLDPKALEALAKKLRTKRMRVHDLSGAGWEDDDDCIAAANFISAYLAALPQAEPADQRLPLANAILDLAFTDTPTERQMLLNGGFTRAANVARDWPTPLFASPTPAASRPKAEPQGWDDVPPHIREIAAAAAPTAPRYHFAIAKAVMAAALSQPHSEK